MFNPADSQEIRDAFGLFWRKKSGKQMPAELKGISLSNVTTFPTRVRVRLLKEICRRHQAANPHLSCFVTNYLPRPELKIRDKKGPMLSLTYSEAVLQMSHHLTTEFLTELSKFARTNLPEVEVRDRFLVLSPDFINPPSPQEDTSSPMVIDNTIEQSSSQVALNDQAVLAASSVNPPILDSLDYVAASLPPHQTISWADDTALSSSSSVTAPPPPQVQLAFSQGADVEEDPLLKRNRDRFLKKATPY